MKLIVKIFTWLSITVLSGAVTTTSEAQETSKTTNTDTAFISKNITENLIGISLAQLAEQKSADIEIKKAAGQIVADHNQVLTHLRRVARKKNMSEANDSNSGLATVIASLPGMQGLETATGRDFEKLWLTQMLARHEAKIIELENVSVELSDVELKSVANRALQKIKIHRDMLSRMKYKYVQ